MDKQTTVYTNIPSAIRPSATVDGNAQIKIDHFGYVLRAQEILRQSEELRAKKPKMK